MMENLTIQDPPPPQVQGGHGGPQPGGGPGGMPQPPGPPGVLGRTPPGPQQLPAQMFTTAAQLLDLTDKKLMIALRDGRKLLGILRSWDQFANLVIQQTKERIFVPPLTAGPDQTRGLYADIDRGIFLVRGENVLLLGEIDLDKDDDPPPGYDLADRVLVERLAKQKKAEDKVREKSKVKKLSTLGFEGENLGDVLLG
ncbi:U6 snRNA-associated Sm-like protein LSm1 [Rhypophila decipiens]